MESKLSKTDLIHKYAKYYYKAYQTGGSEPMKQSIYDIKLRDYGSQLSRSGFNLNKIHEVIQSGGTLQDILNDINNQRDDLENKINNLQLDDKIDKIKAKLTNIRNRLQNSVKQEELDQIVNEYNETVEMLSNKLTELSGKIDELNTQAGTLEPVNQDEQTAP